MGLHQHTHCWFHIVAGNIKFGSRKSLNSCSIKLVCVPTVRTYIFVHVIWFFHSCSNECSSLPEYDWHIRLICMCRRRRRLLSLLTCRPEDRENGSSKFCWNICTYVPMRFLVQSARKMSMSLCVSIFTSELKANIEPKFVTAEIRISLPVISSMLCVSVCNFQILHTELAKSNRLLFWKQNYKEIL